MPTENPQLSRTGDFTFLTWSTKRRYDSTVADAILILAKEFEDAGASFLSKPRLDELNAIDTNLLDSSPGG